MRLIRALLRFCCDVRQGFRWCGGWAREVFQPPRQFAQKSVRIFSKALHQSRNPRECASTRQPIAASHCTAFPFSTSGGLFWYPATMKVIAYCRKSTEQDDRQILSIDAQLRELQEYAAKEQLEIVASLREAKTAKEPGLNASERTLFSPATGFSMLR